MKITPGSRWELRRGEHAGSIVTVERVTPGGTVYYRNYRGGRSVGSSPEDDKGKLHHRAVEQFLLLHKPYRSSLDDERTQPAFRQKNIVRLPAQGGTPLAPAEELQVELAMITPALAQSWLDRGGANRSLREGKVRNLAAAMKRGEWRVTGETIKLNEDGEVADGQHRLEACARSGVTIQSLVVRNVQREAFAVMDTGTSRSIGDVLHIHGYVDTNNLAATVRNLMTWEAIGRMVQATRESREMVNSLTTLEYANAHPELYEALRVARAGQHILNGGIAVWAACFVLFRRVDAKLAPEFEYRLLNGEGLERGNPILILRNRMTTDMRAYVTRTAGDKEDLVASIIKAWNAFRKHEEILTWNQLVWRKTGKNAEPFPRPDQ